MVDYTRRYDLDMLAEAMRNARSSAERTHYEKIMWKIMGESEPISALREDLVEAVRVGDTRRMHYIRDHIHKVRMDETGGGSWGNVRGEGVDKRG